MTVHNSLDLAMVALEDASSLLGQKKKKKTKVRAVRTRDARDKNTGEIIKVVPFADFKKLGAAFIKKYDFEEYPYHASTSIPGTMIEVDCDVSPGGNVIHEIRATYAPMGKPPKAVDRIVAEFPSAAGRSGRGGGGPAPAGPGGIYTLDDYNYYVQFLKDAERMMKKLGSQARSVPAPEPAPQAPAGPSPREFEAALKQFLNVAQKIIDDFWKKSGYTHQMSPILTVDPGRRYVRIVRTGRDAEGNILGMHGSVHCFVDKTNGDVLKAASWKKPAKHARGNIFDPDHGASGVSAYGGRYLASVEKDPSMKTQTSARKVSASKPRGFRTSQGYSGGRGWTDYFMPNDGTAVRIYIDKKASFQTQQKVAKAVMDKSPDLEKLAKRWNVEVIPLKKDPSDFAGWAPTAQPSASVSAKTKLSAEHRRILKAYGAAPNLKALNRIIQKGLISGDEVVLAIQEALKMKRMSPRMAEAIGEALRDVFGVGDIIDLGDRPLAARKVRASWEGKLVGKDVRLTWDYHTFYLEELPQKGKKKLRKLTLRNPMVSFTRGETRRAADGFIPENIFRDQKLTKNDTYDAMKVKLVRGISKVLADIGEDPKKWGYANPTDSLVHYLKVQPEGTEPITVKGKDFQMKVSWTSFSAYKYFGDSGPHDHDPSYVAYEASAPASARKLYKLLKTNPNALASVTIDEFTNWLDKNKIQYKSRHSVYR